MREFKLGTNKEDIFQLLPERKIKRLALGEKTVAILRIGVQIYVFDAHCPHRGADLIPANINGLGEIICPIHQYRFDLKTGQVRSGFCADLPVYSAIWNEDGLHIQIP
jgi:nitrite reductase/ring-hydroxylating ferredoxin subunit